MAILFYSSSSEYFEFSNFYQREIFIQGKKWKTVEHYFQAMKSEDIDVRELICKSSIPSQAKSMGRKINIREDWEEIKDNVMFKALLCKFTQHDDLMKKLINTGEEQLIEDSENDYYWGWGKNHTGKNKLGKLLEKVRDILNELKNY